MFSTGEVTLINGEPFNTFGANTVVEDTLNFIFLENEIDTREALETVFDRNESDHIGSESDYRLWLQETALPFNPVSYDNFRQAAIFVTQIEAPIIETELLDHIPYERGRGISCVISERNMELLSMISGLERTLREFITTTISLWRPRQNRMANDDRESVIRFNLGSDEILPEDTTIGNITYAGGRGIDFYTTSVENYEEYCFENGSGDIYCNEFNFDGVERGILAYNQTIYGDIYRGETEIVYHHNEGVFQGTLISGIHMTFDVEGNILEELF